MKLDKKWIWWKYRHEVKSNLLCMPTEKRQLLRELRGSAEQFFQENPEADLEDLKEHLGNPHEIAIEYLRENNPIATCHRLKVVKLIKTVAVIFTLIFVVFFTSIIIYEFFMHNTSYMIQVDSPTEAIMVLPSIIK